LLEADILEHSRVK